MASFDQLAISSKDESSKILSKRDIFLSTYCQQQAWSLPDNIIYFITKNPSTSICYQKMIQTCKHFFNKNPILVVPELYLEYRNSRWNARFDGRRVDINRIISKIWASFRIVIDNREPTESHVLSSIILQIYKSGIKRFRLYKQNIYLDHLKFLASECETIHCSFVTVMNENGSVVPLEKIIEIILNVKDFFYDCGYDGDPTTEVISSKTVFELIRIPHFSNLTRFALCDIPEAFDIETFYDYIKKNKNTSIRLDFCEGLSDAYKNRLQVIIDEINDNESREYKPPFIYFLGMTDFSLEKMRNLHVFHECI